MRFVAILLLAFPLRVSADLVQLEYEGVVESVTRTVRGRDPTRHYAPDHAEYTGYSVGDRLRGTLTIDLAKAPPDRAHEPEVGIYRSPPNSGGYISGIGAPLIDPVLHRVDNDHVAVVDAAHELPFELYVVRDHWGTPNGHGHLLVEVSDRVGFDLVSGPGIAQTIDATPSSGLALGGFLSKVVRGVKGSVRVLVDLAFDRVRVTPGQCRP
jgi:hypothetical protein